MVREWDTYQSIVAAAVACRKGSGGAEAGSMQRCRRKAEAEAEVPCGDGQTTSAATTDMREAAATLLSFRFGSQ